MFSITSKRALSKIKWVLGACCLAMFSASGSATEYRLFVNDSNACREAGVSGSVCLVPVGAGTAVTGTSTTSTGTSSTASGADTKDCVITTWNRCNGSTTQSTTSTSATTTNTTTNTPTKTTSNTTSSTSVAPGSVSSGNLDFGPGGGNANGRTIKLTVTNNTTAYPFTLTSDSYAGQVFIAPRSSGFPKDGSGIRLWLSKTKGGTPLSSKCAVTAGSEGGLTWDTDVNPRRGCSVANLSGKVYLNLRSCISTRSDATCTSDSAKPGSSAPIYIVGSKKRR